MTNDSLTATEMGQIAQARFAAIVRAPYMASVLTAMTFVRQSDLGTVAVDRKLRVYIDPTVLHSWSPVELAGALLHEANHVLRCHHQRQVGSGVSPSLWNAAADLEINDDLTRASIELPEGALQPGRFGLPEHELAEWYAARLLERHPDDEHPRCGSGAGGVVGDFELGDDREVPGMSEIQIDRLRDTVARAIAAHGHGVPGGLERWAQARLRSTAPWQQVLAAAVRRALPRGAGHDNYSWSRPRRHNPTNALLPTLRGVPAHVAVIIDSSGSMSQHHLDQAVSDVAVLRALPDVTRLTVVSCDTDACDAAIPRSGSAIALIGGGGTSLGAGLDHVARLRPRADLVVVITDGFTDWPPEAPSRLAPVVALMPQGAPCGPTWMTTMTRTLSSDTQQLVSHGAR